MDKEMIYLGINHTYTKIETRTISNTQTLRPSVGKLHFTIPAVRGIVRHLRHEVLAETHLLRSNTHTHEEHVGTSHEVSQGLVRNHTLLHSLSHYP